MAILQKSPWPNPFIMFPIVSVPCLALPLSAKASSRRPPPASSLPPQARARRVLRARRDLFEPRCPNSAGAMHPSSSLLGERSSSYTRLPLKCGQRTGLPLVPCPKCGEEILELVATSESKVPGAIFLKCRLHDRDVPGSCPWYLFADKYERMLLNKGLIQVDSSDTVPELADEVGGLQGHVLDVEAPKTCIGGLDANLKKLVALGQIGVVCCSVVTMFVVVGVISMFVK